MHLGDGEEIELQQNLWVTSLDPDRAMLEWLQTLTGRISARLLSSSSTFQYFAAAAPGAKELVSMVKVRELCEGRHRSKSRSVRDSKSRSDGSKTRPMTWSCSTPPPPATRWRCCARPRRSPQSCESAHWPSRPAGYGNYSKTRNASAYVAVTHASEMAVTETFELEEGLRSELERDLDAVVVNGTVPRRFSARSLRDDRAARSRDGAKARAPTAAPPRNGAHGATIVLASSRRKSRVCAASACRWHPRRSC